MRERTRFKVAAVQMTSTIDLRSNVERAIRLVRRAARAGAALVALPENFAYLRSEGSKVAFRESLEGPLVTEFREEAARLSCYLLLGSIPERIPRSPKIHNTSVLIGPDGGLLAVYRKLHLFDIDVPGRVSLRESRTVAPGEAAVVVKTPLGTFGLSICYDLRFPELYRELSRRGASVLFVPAAFTSFTGPFHWLPLLRARAIENQCWVVAPAQVGRHFRGRRSHGETVVIDPWGEVRARKATGEGFVSAQLDARRTARVRRDLPCLRHRREFLRG